MGDKVPDPSATDHDGFEVMLSVLVLAYNEEDSVGELYKEVVKVCDENHYSWEIIFIDDGSTDETPKRLAALASKDDRIRIVSFRRNYGRAAGMDAGFQRARGKVIITLDADLQDDPSEIPNFLAMIDSGYDVVSGWKKVRHDPIDKTLPSKIFNAVVSRVTGVHLHDFGCGIKAYRSESVKGLRVYGELHRFVAVLVHWRGFRVGEMVVNHRPRKFGVTKFGVERLLKGFLDLLTIMLTTRFSARPLHIFGGAGVIFGLLGFGCLLYLAILWFMDLGPIGTRPLLTLGWLLVVVGVQLVSMGLLAELVQRQGASDPLSYVVRSDNKPAPMSAPERQLAIKS